MCVNSGASRPINIDGEPLEHIQEFTYLGSVINTDNSAQKDIKAYRLNKARCAFTKLKKIWKSKSKALRLKCASTTVTLNLCYCTALNAGELSKGT